VIQLQGEYPISFSPSVFIRMLKLPESTITFKGEEARQFIKEINYRFELLQEYLEYTGTMPEDLSNIQVNLLKNPYKEIAWFFMRITGHD
jgi:hypothetical protein